MSKKRTNNSSRLFANAFIRKPAKPIRAQIPSHIQDSADVWFDVFFECVTSGALYAKEDFQNAQSFVDYCAEIADAALEKFESRWPGVEK